ncbi:MAG: leucine-rich repeat domain-containing protein [Ruminococcaceae bacterium]|nr:leucine-rich repeat domain-containing protein [Oscillospiraceae bacterium]
MSYLTSRKYTPKREFSVIYNNFRGVDFSESGSEISRERFAYLENMYRDYDLDGGGVIESIPGYRRIYDTKKRINGIFSYKNSHGNDIIVLHSENSVYQIPLSDMETHENVRVASGIEDAECDAYCSRDSLYILDGKDIFVVSDDYVGHAGIAENQIYIPTTHVNGEEYEQRNLLTRYFYERYNVSSPDSLAYGTPSLKYLITDNEKLECAVCGISDETNAVYIPSRVKFGDTYYSVKAIDQYAFKNNESITECHVAYGVTTLGTGAFRGCSALKEVILPDTVLTIGDSCFLECQALVRLHFGSGLQYFGYSACSTCPSLDTISYSADETQFQKIENIEFVGDVKILYNTRINSVSLGLKINNPAEDILEVKIDNETYPFTLISNGSTYEEILITLDDKNKYNGKTITVKGVLSSNKSDYADKYHGFVSSNYKGIGKISEIISKCRIAESFDGRIFLTGNPDYPGFCFYSSFDTSGENHPLYFGEMNYFKDGVGNFNNVAILAAADSLAIFKERDDGGGSIYYHTPESTGINILPKIYPVSYVHSGFVAKGKAISFFDDPVFVSSKGISALAKKNINLERSIATRSNKVNKRLLSEDLSAIKLAVWKGYLVVLAGDRIYLADSRATFSGAGGETEYEWFYLSGIGSYKNDKRVYRYSPTAHKGLLTHEKTDEPTEETVYSTTVNGERILYTIEGGKEYEVYVTEERRGGDFSPPTHILSINDLLIFGTGDGQVFVFNTDKRGIAPPDVAAEAEFDEEEYKNAWGKSIHPSYYSFAGHAIRYAIQTKRDDCSIPHLVKDTVKNSLIIKCKSIAGGKIICEVGTDNGGYRELTRFPSRDLFFSDIDFSSFSLSADGVYTLPIHEREKGWVEKQITLYSDEFASPFAICVIAYRFYTKGKIKRNR